MKPQSFLALAFAFAALWLAGCAGGPILHQPTISQSEMNTARATLATHPLEPSQDLSHTDLKPTLDRVWKETKHPMLLVCRKVFQGCKQAMGNMRVVVVNRNDVNAYADATDFTIGVHAGFLRAAGDDDEIAAVLAHEAAHLLFGHAQKKASNAAGYGLIGGLAGIALGAALHQPGMDPEYVGDMGEAGFNVGYETGYLAYSPEMELEADQFAMSSSKCDAA